MSTALALLPDQSEWNQIKEISCMAVRSGLLPDAIKTPEAAAIIALKGRELGIPPMVAFAHINVIKGKPCCSSELMLAYIKKDFPNSQIVFEETTDTKCVIKAKRPGDEKFSTFEMTFDQALKAGFARQWDKDKKEWYTKDNWAKQPKTMLRWRCVSEMKRFLFPEVLMGIDYTPDELQDTKDVTPRDAQPAVQEQPLEVKTIKNFAPQSAEQAKDWKPGSVSEEKLDKQDLLKKIVKERNRLGWSLNQMQEHIIGEFGKPPAELSDEELTSLYQGLTAK